MVLLKSLNKNLFKQIIEYIELFFLAVLFAVMYQLFVVKNNFAPAGLNGIATMVQYKTGFSIGYMSLLINIPLGVLAYFLVDKKFAKRSLFFSVVYSLVYIYLQSIDLAVFQYDAKGHDTIFPVILSGVIGGFVYGSCFKIEASTGGTDIISKYISKKHPSMNFFYITFSINAIVAVSSFFVYGQRGNNGMMIYDYKPVCLCILYCFLATKIGNNIIAGTKKAYKFTIITSHPDEIKNEIFAVIRHGATKVEAIGSYSNDKKSMLICVINPHQISDLKGIIMKYDGTFAYSERVNETYGNFKRVRSK